MRLVVLLCAVLMCWGAPVASVTPAVHLSAHQPVVRPSAPLLVSWRVEGFAPMELPTHSLVLLPSKSMDLELVLWKEYLPSDSTQGEFKLRAPSEPGLYRFHLRAPHGEILFSSSEVLVAACAPAGQTNSNIKHVVFVIMENHSFDTVFGHYCQAPNGSNPSCTSGPQCCEAIPAVDPGTGQSPLTLSDASNGIYDPNHGQACEVQEINGGKMDKFVKGASCSNPGNFAVANNNTYGIYWSFAQQYALADRYFQPIAGATSSNKMYIARASYMFTDNAWFPYQAIGTSCNQGNWHLTDVPNMGDLMISCNVPFWTAAGGYDAMRNACPNATQLGCCPPIDPSCPARKAGYPCSFDASDVPFQYWNSTRDNPLYIKDLDDDFYSALAAGKLPAFVYAQPIGYKTEHPGSGTTCTAGAKQVQQIYEALKSSPHWNDTLLLVTWDEGGGFFDHVAPPPNSPVDGQPYGTRVPLLALGYFAKNNYISHVQMEHSSIPVFLEWNFFGGQTGQLGQRDTYANNILDLLNEKAFL